MIIVIETVGGGRTEIDCEPEEGARIMQAIFDTKTSGLLRITMSNAKKEIIINIRHLIKAFAVYPATEEFIDGWCR